MKKYSLTKESKVNIFNKTLFRIQAEMDFGIVKKGELGGWVESEKNLNAEVSGNAWVYGDARVYGKLKISAGFFFGMRYDKEEIKFKENEGQEIIYKGEAKFE